MLLSKTFTPISIAHCVRNCYDAREAENLHGHTFTVTLEVESDTLDNAGQVMDPILLSGPVTELIESFDHSLLVWAEDHGREQEHTSVTGRLITLPVSPSMEQLGRTILVLTDRVLGQVSLRNGECTSLKVSSVKISEEAEGVTVTCHRQDAFTPSVGGPVHVNGVVFSDEIKSCWKTPLAVLLAGTFRMDLEIPDQQVQPYA